MCLQSTCPHYTGYELAYVAGDPNAGVNRMSPPSPTTPTPRRTSTTLFGIDSHQRAGPHRPVGGNPDSPATGKLTTIGNGLGVDTTERIGFDIADGTVSIAFASLTAPVPRETAPDQPQHRRCQPAPTSTHCERVHPRHCRRPRRALYAAQRPACAGEAAGSVTVTVNRSIPSQVAASVNVELLAAGDDRHRLQPAGLLLSFAAGETSKTFTINVTDDGASRE
jgi:hypothetical protein